MMDDTVNINVGVLGHVDCGKTSLCKSLSTTASTACFDKNPQSQERGITIDLGFSSFLVDTPDHMKNLPYSKLQFTLVDCPGHASLIRTIIGGSQIIDMMMLVIDVTKGMQTQTAECLVIGKLTCKKMVVVLNKIDLLPDDNRMAIIEKMSKKMKLTLAKIGFQDAPIVSVAAKPGGPDTSTELDPIGINDLIQTLRQCTIVPERRLSDPFLFSVDHCFGIRGQGTVMTGTVLQGALNVNDTVEIPSLLSTKKVKSMQMFRQPVNHAGQGDRLGICVTQFDPKQLERGYACSPGYVSNIIAAIISIRKITYFKGAVCTKARFHISLGHETVRSKISLFGLTDHNLKYVDDISNDTEFDFNSEYTFQDELLSKSDNEDHEDGDTGIPTKQFALLEFEKSVLAVPKCLVIGSKLDMDIHESSCRIAFWGKLLEGIKDKNYQTTVLPQLKVYKLKSKTGVVERAVNEYEVIGKSIFKKETNIQLFSGLKVTLSTGEHGIIEGSFAQSGKVKIRIPDGLKESTFALISSTAKKKGKQSTPSQKTTTEPVQINLVFKRYIYDSQKKMLQTS